MLGRNVGGAAAFSEEKHVSPGNGVFPRERLAAMPKAVRRQRFGPRESRPVRRRGVDRENSLYMIAGDAIPRRHHFAIKPNSGRICQFFRDFSARIPLTC
jgi:hypothetical protein